MDIEAIVKKYTNKTGWAFAHDSCEKSMRAALTELAAGYEQRLKKIQADDLMAQCMEQTQNDLIAAGVIDKKCAPMFLADAVISRIRNLEQKDYTGGDAELLRDRIRQLDAKWSRSEEAMPKLNAILAAAQKKKEGE